VIGLEQQIEYVERKLKNQASKTAAWGSISPSGITLGHKQEDPERAMLSALCSSLKAYRRLIEESA